MAHGAVFSLDLFKAHYNLRKCKAKVKITVGM